MTARDKESYSIQSVENALDVLEALCDEEDEVRISRLSEKLGMNKTSVFRLLATFENRGYVEKEAQTGKYRLGMAAYEMGQKFLSRMTLLRKARPVMERLSRSCNETVYLAMRRYNDVLFLDMVDTAQQVKVISLVGKRYPLAACAAGKVILAYLPETAKPRRGNGSAGQPAEPLLAESDRSLIRQRGGWSDQGELGEGIASLAAPIFGAGGELAGCLCLVGPDFRLSAEKMTIEFQPRLKEAAEMVSSRLGFVSNYLEKAPY